MTLEGLECKPPYWNSSSLLPLCSTQEELQAVASGFLTKLLKEDIQALRPCRKFENIVFGYEDIEIPDGSDNSSLIMSFQYSTKNYKELNGVRNMDLQTFIGN